MAFLQCGFHSDALGKACDMNVIIPQRVRTQIGMTSSGGRTRYPVLYLLHGLSDNHSIWMRRTAIERYAAAYELVVVMPDGGRSFYTDMASGARYWTFLSEELPEIVCSLFPVSERREDTFAAGLSMGGYGALKLALARPERFAAAAGISSVARIDHFIERMRGGFSTVAEADSYFGPGAPPPEADLFVLAERAAKRPEAERPRLFQICGTEDALYADNVELRNHLRQLGAFPYRYAEAPGAHTWEFWDHWIQEILRWLPLDRG